jgi:hypothetical protein
MIKNSYLHIPITFNRYMRENIILTESEETYLYWGVKPIVSENSFDDYYTIPINHQEIVSIDEIYNYSDININIRVVSNKLFDILLNGANKLLIIVDFDNIPRTPFISSANRILNTNMYNVSLSLKPFNCYRLYTTRPISEYASYKILYNNAATLIFDPPYTLIKTQTEVII